jgi:hypothetical protein
LVTALPPLKREGMGTVLRRVVMLSWPVTFAAR